MLAQRTAIIRSFDEKRAKDFCLDSLGFEPLVEARSEDWTPVDQRAKESDCTLHLSEHHGDGCAGAEICISFENIGSFIAELRARQFGNSRPGEPQDTLWRTKISMADPADSRRIFYSIPPTKTES